MTHLSIICAVEHLRPIPYLPQWIVILITLQSAILMYLYLYSPKLIILPILSLIDKRVFREMMEAKNSFQLRLLKIMDIIFYISISLLIYSILHIQPSYLKKYLFSIISSRFLQQWTNVFLFLAILISIIVLSSFKKLSFYLPSVIFDDKRYDTFLFNFKMFMRAIGLVLFIGMFIYLWQDEASIYILYYLLGGMILLYLWMTIYSFFTLPHKPLIDYLNFILYLCGLEIIPILVFLKLLFKYNG